MEFLKEVAVIEGIQLSIDITNRIGEKSQRSLHRALYMFQTCITQK
jgi:hypothetical protein